VRVADRAQQGPLERLRRRVPVNAVGAGDDTYVRAFLGEQRGALQRGLPGADDRHVLALELGQFAVVAAVRGEFEGELAQRRGHVHERHHADGDHDHTRDEHLALSGLHAESACAGDNGRHRLLVGERRGSPAEPLSVLGERADGQRTSVLHSDAASGAVRGQCVRTGGVGEVGGPGLGLEEHALRHVVAPRGHGAAEYAQIESGCGGVGGDGEAVGAGAHHYEVVHAFPSL
jgi:hypothetical protein